MTSNWLEFYRKFLKGHNFLPWFRRKHAVAEKEQYKLWRLARLKIDIDQLMSNMSELEVADCFHAIEGNLRGEIQYGKANEDTEEVRRKMRRDLQSVFVFLPEDRQQLLIMDPERASLLQQN